MLRPTLEERVAHVENDVVQLKSRVERLLPGQGWIDKITGSLKTTPTLRKFYGLAKRFDGPIARVTIARRTELAI